MKRLTPRHQQIARLILNGITQRQIAADMHLSEGYLSRLVHSAHFQHHLKELENKADFDALQCFKSNLEAACNVVVGYLHDTQAAPSTRLAAARLVLQLGQQATQPTAPAFVPFEQRMMMAGLL